MRISRWLALLFLVALLVAPGRDVKADDCFGTGPGAMCIRGLVETTPSAGTSGQPGIVSLDINRNLRVGTNPGSRTLVALDVATVTTGGTAVTALSAGHRTAGGWIANPIGAAAALCINEIGTASGTTSSGSTTCIAAGQTYLLAPAAGAVSVISSDSSHPFSGEGWQ